MEYLKLFEEFKKSNESNIEEFTQFSQLVGKTINRVYINGDRSKLCFLTNDNEYHCYYANGDCCNSVWFNHFNGIDFVLFQRVNDVISKTWIDVDISDRVMSQECEEACVWTLITSKGYIDIELRNNHNGYYGGTISHQLESRNSTNNMEIIYDDF